MFEEFREIFLFYRSIKVKFFTLEYNILVKKEKKISIYIFLKTLSLFLFLTLSLGTFEVGNQVDCLSTLEKLTHLSFSISFLPLYFHTPSYAFPHSQFLYTNSFPFSDLRSFQFNNCKTLVNIHLANIKLTHIYTIIVLCFQKKKKKRKKN